MKRYILVLDCGTTNIKALLFDKKGEIHAQVKKKSAYIIEQPGQVEQDPVFIWNLSREVIEELLKKEKLSAENINAIGITTQRSSFLLWDKKSGLPLTNIITWQDKRSAVYANKVSNSPLFKLLRGICAVLSRVIRSTKMILFSILKFDTVHSSVRTGFLFKNNPELKRKAWAPGSSVAWGTIDSWLLWNLTGQKRHATDYSSVSSTGLLDPFSLTWNPVVLKLFKIPMQILPEIKATGDQFGETTLFGGGRIPIHCLFADQQASLFGQCCFEPGDIKCTNGTGSFIDLNTGEKPYASQRQLYPLVAWNYEGKTTYMLEGQSQNTGNIIDWLEKELKLISSPEETETLALSVQTTGGVYFLPAFTTGLTFPYWDSSARGNLFGINLKTSKAQIVRAILEGICFRIKDIVDGIRKDTGIKITNIKLDGGASNNHFILQFLSDILGVYVDHFKTPESTALGAAFMAGLKSGFWSSMKELKGLIQLESRYSPMLNDESRKKRYKNWQNIIYRSLKYNPEEE